RDIDENSRWFPDFRVYGPRGQKFRILPHRAGLSSIHRPCPHAEKISELFRRWGITSDHLYRPGERLPWQVMPWRPYLAHSDHWTHYDNVNVLTGRPRLGPAPGYTWRDVQQVQRLLHFIEATAEEVNENEEACAQATALLEEEFGPWLDYVAPRFA